MFSRSKRGFYFISDNIFGRTMFSGKPQTAPVAVKIQLLSQHHSRGFCALVAKWGNSLSPMSIKDQSEAASPGILPSNRPCPLLSGGGWGRGLGASRRELLGNCIFSLIMGSWGLARSALEASGPWRW